jgi:hypothetical protein
VFGSNKIISGDVEIFRNYTFEMSNFKEIKKDEKIQKNSIIMLRVLESRNLPKKLPMCIAKFS